MNIKKKKTLLYLIITQFNNNVIFSNIVSVMVLALLPVLGFNLTSGLPVCCLSLLDYVHGSLDLDSSLTTDYRFGLPFLFPIHLIVLHSILHQQIWQISPPTSSTSILLYISCPLKSINTSCTGSVFNCIHSSGFIIGPNIY